MSDLINLSEEAVAATQTMTINDLQLFHDKLASGTKHLQILQIEKWLETYIYNLQNFRMDELKEQLINYENFLHSLTDLCESKA